MEPLRISMRMTDSLTRVRARGHDLLLGAEPIAKNPDLLGRAWTGSPFNPATQSRPEKEFTLGPGITPDEMNEAALKFWSQKSGVQTLPASDGRPRAATNMGDHIANIQRNNDAFWAEKKRTAPRYGGVWGGGKG